MPFLHTSQRMPKIVLIMCVWGIFPLTTDQFPVVGDFNLLLYPYGSHALLIPVRTAERRQTPQTNGSAISSQSLSNPSNANGAFLQPEAGSGPAPGPAPNPALGPAPGLHTAQSQSSVLQAQNLIPSNVPLQVYAFVQQTLISESGSSEEGDTAQVVYMVPVRVESPSMGVMESTAPAPSPAPVPDPGPLHVPVTSSRAAGETPSAGTGAQTHMRGKRRL